MLKLLSSTRGFGICSALLFLTGIAFGQATSTALRLPSFFSDHMVLQRNQPLPVWGTASPNEKVTVNFNGQQRLATAGADGRWTVKLKPCTAGGPYELAVHAGAATVIIKDVLVGEVWIGSGQSNMEMSVAGVKNSAEEIAQANDPQMRLFTVARTMAAEPQQDVKGKWAACTPQTVSSFSAAAYFFGRELRRKLGVPVGLIESCWSGSSAEAWTPREALAAHPELRPILNRDFTDKAAFDAAMQAFQAKVPAWSAQDRPVDTGNTGFKAGWADPAADVRKWFTMPLPNMFAHSEPALYCQGAFWFRREVTIPAAWAGHPLTLSLGSIADFDTTYFNGVQVGMTNTDAPDTAKVERMYTVPGKLVTAGRAVIAIRTFTRYGEAGFGGKPETLQLAVTGLAGQQPLPLAGDWRYRAERAVPFKPLPHAPTAPDSVYSPVKLYNGMIAPLVHFGIRGVIWYQGESNSDLGYQYRTLFPVMIKSWRKAWGQGDFPFLYVQIANWIHHQDVPCDTQWPELREAQLMTLSVPNTGMAVTIDIGEGPNIHPLNKQDVGYRLALAAEKIAYGMRIAYSGPIYRSMRIEGNRIRLSFKHTDGGLQAGRTQTEPELTGFIIAGQDRVFVPAQAKIEGNSVVVWSEDIAKPVAVRYAWQFNPRCNLYNGAGLPASPFRTDDWPGMSFGVGEP
ncbi:MAG TPA: sialate O-acetylesterase [Armatimonadota bacterium]